MKKIRCQNILSSQGILNGYVYFDQGKIVMLTREKIPTEESFDAGECYLSAGWIDLHTHGGGGHSFDGSVEDILGACRFHLRHGTTTLCPTVSAAPFATMAEAAKRIAAAAEDPRMPLTLLGAHMEGPYLSPGQCGAQCPAHITPPRAEDYLPFLQENPKAVSRWTYAPENDGDQAFVKTLRSFGIVASAGHSDARYCHMKEAVREGCDLVTHLYSCTSTVTRDHGFRSLGIIESAFLLDDLFVEIICDGKHLPPELIQMICKIKGPHSVALITDSLSPAGTEALHGFMQDTEYLIEDGVCKLMDRSAFAGSIATADRLLRVAVKEAGIPLPEAVQMLTRTPARIMRLSHKGDLLPGMDADFVIFREDCRVKQVFTRGNAVFSS